MSVEFASAENAELNHPRYPLIALIGSMGSGKSTLSELLKINLSVPGYAVAIHEERFPENPFLEQFYEKPHMYSYLSQRFFLEAKSSQLRDVKGRLADGAVIIDPGQEMDYLFAQAQYQMGWMTTDEFGMYAREFIDLKRIYELPTPDVYITVNADAALIRARISERARPYELSMVSRYPGYFDLLHDLVEKFSLTASVSPVIKIDSGRYNFIDSPYGKWRAVGNVLDWIGYYNRKRADGEGSADIPIILPKYIT